MNFDYYLFQQLNNLAGQHKFIGFLSIFFAKYFLYILTALVLLFWFSGEGKEQRKKNRLMVFLALVSALVSRYVFVVLIRMIYFRPRPYVAHQVFQLVAHEPTGSFPSGHAAFIFGLAIVVYIYNKRAGYWFFAGAFLISLARVFAGVHYPLDILAGAAVGIFTGWLVIKISKKFIT